MAEFRLKRNDTLPYLDVRLKDSDTEYTDLTVSGVSVNFTMKDFDTGVLKINSMPCTILDGATGAVRYTWEAIDTDTAGFYIGEFEVIYIAGKKTYPPDDSLVIYIIEDFNND